MDGITIRKLPSWAPMAGITFRRTIFLKRPDDQQLLAHELIHVQQQLAHPIWFWVSYILLLPFGWNPWRASWEAEAYAKSIRVGRTTEERAAKMLSGSLYLWTCSYEKALAKIRAALDKMPS